MRQDIQAIKKVGEKASGLVRQLLAFSKRQVMQPRVMNLNHAISDMSKMLQRLVGEHINLITTLDPNLGYVKADPVQIEQVLLNLAVNSRDAMPAGSNLMIETANIQLKDSPIAANLAVASGDLVMLTFRDTGSGMDQETIAHAFEPFFSTKDTGRGSGLGLSTVYGIINQSGGNISVESEAGLGTTFKIYLPRVEKDPEMPERILLTNRPRPENETILVTEDEEGVRGVVRAFLQGKGYTVLEARDGVEALEVYSKHHDRIHLLVTDLVMPRMGGLELAQRLTRSNPGLKVLYMSGYSDRAVSSQGVLEPGTMFLQKPFSTDKLAQFVRRLLDGPDEEDSDPQENP
jgi:CheY-like chemotaxis protein